MHSVLQDLRYRGRRHLSACNFLRFVAEFWPLRVALLLFTPHERLLALAPRSAPWDQRDSWQIATDSQVNVGPELVCVSGP